MPRNKVLEKAKVSIPSGRNAVDLSQEKSYAQLAADLNVCYCMPVVAGTKGHISRKCFTRTADVVSPAFHRITEHFDFFIVPIHSLWRYWENWKVNINDMQDTNLVPFKVLENQVEPDMSLPLNVPRMNHFNLIANLGYKVLNDGETVINFVKNSNDCLRLLEQLRYGTMHAAVGQGRNNILNLFKAAAYQKCYFDHYRNTAYESNNPYAYNLDWLTADSNHAGVLSPTAPADIDTDITKDTYVARELFKIRRVNYRNDYFHNLYPALNYVSTQNSAPNGADWRIPSNVAGASMYNGSTDRMQIDSATYNGVHNPTLIQAYSSVATRLDVQSIRAAFALDKLMRASAYAPKRVRDQYKALYGIDGVEDFDMRSERIGSFQSDVQLAEVTQMVNNAAAGEPSNLGALGAKGVGGDKASQSISYYAKYDSIIIGLHYFLPRCRYDNYGVDPWNVKLAREDFYIKAFENLGLRPMYAYVLDNRTVSPSTMLGWSVPNFEYKILPDLNEGPFKQTFVQVTDGDDSYDVDLIAQSELRTFVPHNQNMYRDQNFVTAESFKAAPEDLNSLFAVAVPGDHRLSVYQFYGDFRISHAAVIPMSIHGQPSL